MVRFSAILMEKTLDFFFSFAAKGYFQFCFQTQEINRFIFKPWWVHSHSYSFVLHRYSLELKKTQSLYNPTECCSYQVDLTFIQPFQQVSPCLIIFVQDIVANFFMEFDLHFQTNKTTKKTSWINYIKKKKKKQHAKFLGSFFYFKSYLRFLKKLSIENTIVKPGVLWEKLVKSIHSTDVTPGSLWEANCKCLLVTALIK